MIGHYRTMISHSHVCTHYMVSSPFLNEVDSFDVVLNVDDGKNGTEDLFGHHFAIGSHVHQHCWFDPAVSLVIAAPDNRLPTLQVTHQSTAAQRIFSNSQLPSPQKIAQIRYDFLSLTVEGGLMN